jgi:hypothetical protein
MLIHRKQAVRDNRKLHAAFKVAVAVHNKNNYKALEVNEKMQVSEVGNKP